MTESSTTSSRPQARGRLQFLLIAAVFFGPLVVAAWLYYGGEGLQPARRVNHGALLEPIVNVAGTETGVELPAEADGKWLLIFNESGACGDECRSGLYTMRQSRLMLGREMDRLERIFLHGDTPPDTLFLAEEHRGLLALEDRGLSARLANKKPAELDGGGYYLVDPLGNLVLYFPPEIDPGDMVDDIKRLLRLSRIG